jgi:hypothetical protein
MGATSRAIARVSRSRDHLAPTMSSPRVYGIQTDWCFEILPGDEFPVRVHRTYTQRRTTFIADRNAGWSRPA